jgi:hypothetical protein
MIDQDQRKLIVSAFLDTIKPKDVFDNLLDAKTVEVRTDAADRVQRSMDALRTKKVAELDAISKMTPKPADFDARIKEVKDHYEPIMKSLQRLLDSTAPQQR